jgi:hypothetical protein
MRNINGTLMIVAMIFAHEKLLIKTWARNLIYGWLWVTK